LSAKIFFASTKFKAALQRMAQPKLGSAETLKSHKQERPAQLAQAQSKNFRGF